MHRSGTVYLLFVQSSFYTVNFIYIYIFVFLYIYIYFFYFYCRNPQIYTVVNQLDHSSEKEDEPENDKLTEMLDTHEYNPFETQFV